MATGKRQPSKQKRAAQNRAQRAALAARRDAASGAGASSGYTRKTAASGGERRGMFGLGGMRAQAAAGRAAQPVGYRAGLSALLMSLAGVLFCFTFQVPVDGEGESFTTESLVATWAGSALDAAVATPDATGADVLDTVEEWAPGRTEDPIAIALWPFSLALALPVIGAGIGFRAVAKRSHSKVVSRALFATLFGSLLSQIPIFFLPAVAALGVAVFQIRKYETTTAAAALRNQMAPEDTDDDVIEAEVVDEADGDDRSIGDFSGPDLDDYSGGSDRPHGPSR